MIKLPKTKIRNFEYNGFYGRHLKGFAKFKVISFIKWTSDPGIGVFGCSDGKERLLPTWVFSDSKGKSEYGKIQELIPEQPKENLVMFGSPSSSEKKVGFLELL